MREPTLWSRLLMGDMHCLGTGFHLILLIGTSGLLRLMRMETFSGTRRTGELVMNGLILWLNCLMEDMSWLVLQVHLVLDHTIFG